MQFLSLLDTGAGGNFMDIEFAQNNNIQMRNKPAPCDMETVDGSPLPMRLFLLKSKWRLTIMNFQMITLTRFLIILGIAWFSSYNPSIIWGTGTLYFMSDHCKEDSKESCQASFPLTKQSKR